MMDTNGHKLTIALAGIPNAGKTTLFNSLTGLNKKLRINQGRYCRAESGPWTLNARRPNSSTCPPLQSDATSLANHIARDIITGEQGGRAQT